MGQTPDQAENSSGSAGNDPETEAREVAKPLSPGAAPDDRQRTAAFLVLIYLCAHVAILAIVTFFPLIKPLLAEERAGRFYLGLVQTNFANAFTAVIAPLLLVVTATAFWRAEMKGRRIAILGLSVAGLLLSALFLAVLIFWGYGDDLTQGEFSPAPEQLEIFVRTFVKQNGVIFAGVLLGVFGFSMFQFVRRLLP